MRRSAQARQQRAQGIGTGREITMPLPLGGLFSEAKTSEISGVYAGEFVNWESAGTKIRLRKQAISLSPESAILRRIPYEFGADPRYIEIYADRAKCGDAEIIRPFAADCSVAYISGQAIIADGQGFPVRFDGVAFHQIDMDVQGGADPATFDGVVAHHDRLFFWATGGELEFYHSATVGGLQGEFLRFPLGRLGNITGSIRQMQSLTINAGHGMNDTLAIMTSTGEIVAYEGLDPADAMDWRLLTRVRASTPVGPEAFARIGNDLWMVSGSGIVSIMESISQGVLALVGNASRPIVTEITALIEQGGRWQMHVGADGSQVIVNRIKDGEAKQHVFHVETRTWSVTDYPAAGFHNLNGKTEFTDMNGRLRRLRRLPPMIWPVPLPTLLQWALAMCGIWISTRPLSGRGRGLYSWALMMTQPQREQHGISCRAASRPFWMIVVA